MSRESRIQDMIMDALEDPNATVSSLMVAITRQGGLAVVEGELEVATAASRMLRAGAEMTEAQGEGGGHDELLNDAIEAAKRARAGG